MISFRRGASQRLCSVLKQSKNGIYAASQAFDPNVALPAYFGHQCDILLNPGHDQFCISDDSVYVMQKTTQDLKF